VQHTSAVDVPVCELLLRQCHLASSMESVCPSVTVPEAEQTSEQNTCYE